MSELAHMNRRATAGELSASIAHELNQPLGAILNNTETAELLLPARRRIWKKSRKFWVISDVTINERVR